MSEKTDAEHRAAITAQTDQNDAALEAWMRDFLDTASQEERQAIADLFNEKVDITEFPPEWRRTLVGFAAQEWSQLTARILGGDR